MALLDLSNAFTFTTKDQLGNEKELSGTFRDLTKKEQNDFKNKNEAVEVTIKKAQKIIDTIKRNARYIEIKEKTEDWGGIEKLTTDNYKLEDELIKITEKFNADEERRNILKDRFTLCLGGEHKDVIMELAEAYGYEELMKVIGEAVAEGKSAK
jgi:hypothetical protein